MFLGWGTAAGSCGCSLERGSIARAQHHRSDRVPRNGRKRPRQARSPAPPAVPRTCAGPGLERGRRLKPVDGPPASPRTDRILLGKLVRHLGLEPGTYRSRDSNRRQHEAVVHHELRRAARSRPGNARASAGILGHLKGHETGKVPPLADDLRRGRGAVGGAADSRRRVSLGTVLRPRALVSHPRLGASLAWPRSCRSTPPRPLPAQRPRQAGSQLAADGWVGSWRLSRVAASDQRCWVKAEVAALLTPGVFERQRTVVRRAQRRDGHVLALFSVGLGMVQLVFPRWAEAHLASGPRLGIAGSAFLGHMVVVGVLLWRMERRLHSVRPVCPQCGVALKDMSERVASPTGKCDNCGGWILKQDNRQARAGGWHEASQRRM